MHGRFPRGHGTRRSPRSNGPVEAIVGKAGAARAAGGQGVRGSVPCVFVVDQNTRREQRWARVLMIKARRWIPRRGIDAHRRLKRGRSSDHVRGSSIRGPTRDDAARPTGGSGSAGPGGPHGVQGIGCVWFTCRGGGPAHPFRRRGGIVGLARAGTRSAIFGARSRPPPGVEGMSRACGPGESRWAVGRRTSPGTHPRGPTEVQRFPRVAGHVHVGAGRPAKARGHSVGGGHRAMSTNPHRPSSRRGRCGTVSSGARSGRGHANRGCHDVAIRGAARHTFAAGSVFRTSGWNCTGRQRPPQPRADRVLDGPMISRPSSVGGGRGTAQGGWSLSGQPAANSE